jgi:hypothetical protein
LCVSPEGLQQYFRKICCLETGFIGFWKEYLNAVAENSYTGTWAKEVAMHLLKTEE